LVKRLQGVFVEGSQKDHAGHVLRIQHAQHFQATDARHLNVEKNDFGIEPVNGRYPLNRIGALPEDLNITLLAQQPRNFFASGQLVVNDQDFHAG
jgi:hypothetical protein